MTGADDQLPGPPPVRWGVLGATARAAQSGFLPAGAESPKASLVAVASQSHADGTGYDHFAAGRTYGRYEQLLADEDVEAVYIALPNSLHAEWTVRAAEAGKHVLCERPLATRAAEAKEMSEACEELGVLLMEADATPFHPRSSALADLLKSRRLGTPRFARAHFGGVVDLEKDDFRSRPETGGGVLLDRGTACLAPLLAAAGRRPPLQVAAGGYLARSGVDVSFSAWIDFDKGFTASLTCSFETAARQTLEVVGTEGSVVVDQAFTPGPGDTQLHLSFRDGSTETIDAGGGDPYRGMVDHVAAVLRDSAELRRPPAQSLEILGLADRLREAAAWAW